MHRQDTILRHRSPPLQVVEYVQKRALGTLQDLSRSHQPTVRADRKLGLGADSRVLSLRLHENGRAIVATELDAENWQPLDWQASAVEVDFQLALDTHFSETVVFTYANYDVVIAVEVLEHLKNPRLFLEEAKKLLKPNGVFIISIPSGFGLEYRLKVYRGLVRPYSQLLHELLPELGLNGFISLYCLPNFSWLASVKNFLLTRIWFRSLGCACLKARAVYFLSP